MNTGGDIEENDCSTMFLALLKNVLAGVWDTAETCISGVSDSKLNIERLPELLKQQSFKKPTIYVLQ